MSVQNLNINQPTRSVLLRVEQAQSHLNKLAIGMLGQELTRDESLNLLSEVIEQLNAIQRAIDGEGKEELRGCSVLSFVGEPTIQPDPHMPR